MIARIHHLNCMTFHFGIENIKHRLLAEEFWFGGRSC
jgi:hypothetical protein